MGRRKYFLNKRTVSFAIESDVYAKFIEKCKEMKVLPSEVLREFVGAFILADKVEEHKTIVLNVQLNITRVERAEVKERKSTIELVRQYEVEEFKEKLKTWRASVMTSRNTIELYDIKKAIITWLRKIKNVDEPVLVEAKAVIELCNERLNELRARR